MGFGVSEWRRWREASSRVGRAALPYWFAGSGIVFGVGGVLQDQAMVSACGAVAGVTAGLVQQHRSRFYRIQVEGLRERLRSHRAHSEAVAVELRQAVSVLQTELWEQRLPVVAPTEEPIAEITVQIRPEPEPEAGSEPELETASELETAPELEPTAEVDSRAVGHEAESPATARVIDLRDVPDNGTAVDSVPDVRAGKKRSHPDQAGWLNPAALAVPTQRAVEP